MKSDPVQNVLNRLEGVRQTGPNQWEARCPVHDDRHASLSIGRGDDGRALIDCKAGCPTTEVLHAIGLELGNLYAFCPKPPVVSANKPQADGKTKGRIVATYDYRDSAGALLFQVVRFAPKGFRQRRPDGKNGWTWKLADTPRVLYRLRELLAADNNAWVFITEGEKDADNFVALGLAATTNPSGAGKWSKLADDSALYERRVAIIADKDAPGFTHAQDVGARLHGKADVITRYRAKNSNLRTQFQRIINRAGLEAWPRLFHNLRASRQTELEQLYPSYVVAKWIGNSESIARKHYLMLTEDHYHKAAWGEEKTAQKAARFPAQQPAVRWCNNSQGKNVESAEPAICGAFRNKTAPCDNKEPESIPPRGVEPLSPG